MRKLIASTSHILPPIIFVGVQPKLNNVFYKCVLSKLFKRCNRSATGAGKKVCTTGVQASEVESQCNTCMKSLTNQMSLECVS